MSKVFTYEVQKSSEDGPWSARDGLHIITMSDEWTSGMIAQQAAKDHEKTATDDSWRVVVWNGDDVHEQLRDPDWIIYGHELAGECWCHPIFVQDGAYEWHCPTHGDRSWRPKAKAFQATLGKSETALAASSDAQAGALYPESVVLHNAAVHHALRREVNRIAAHAATEDRTLRWVADELVNALTTNPYPDGSPADEIERLTAELAEERRQHGITAQVSQVRSDHIDDLRRRLHLPDVGAVLPLPPITINDPKA